MRSQQEFALTNLRFEISSFYSLLRQPLLLLPFCQSSQYLNGAAPQPALYLQHLHLSSGPRSLFADRILPNTDSSTSPNQSPYDVYSTYSLPLFTLHTMETNNVPPTNPPSVETAYRRKCIALKKRLTEIESTNDALRARNARAVRYVQKMRLEQCYLLERLAYLTDMVKDINTEYSPGHHAQHLKQLEMRRRQMASMDAGQSNKRPFVDDETEGSSDERPPTVSRTTDRQIQSAACSIPR